MKKMLLTLMLVTVATAGFAQRYSNSGFRTSYSSSETKVDIHAGISLTNITKIEYDLRVGYTFGLGIEHPLYYDQWFIQTGIDFTSKGAKNVVNGVEYRYKPVYLDIPILAKLKVDMSRENKFTVSFGPYISIGLGGKYSVEESGYVTSEKLFTSVGSNDSAYMNRFGIGLQYGIGLEMDEHYLVMLNGQYGFNNMIKQVYCGKNDKNLEFTLSVGYRF